MLDQLRPPSPQQSKSGSEEDKIQKEGKLSSTVESDGDTTLSMTSSEDDESPTSNVRKVSVPLKNRVSRTSITRPEGYSPAKRVSNVSASHSISISKEHSSSPALLSGVSTKRSSAVSKRTSGGWDNLARKSANFRNNTPSTLSVGSKSSTRKSGSSSKGNAKDELIAKLNQQVEMLQEKQKKIDSSHQKTTQNLEAKLEDLRVADSILIGQLRSERNELKDQLDQTNERIQSIAEEQEQALQQEQAAKRAVEQQLADAHSRIHQLSEQAMDDHFGGSKIDVLRERRRAIEAQMAKPQSPAAETQNAQANADMEKMIQSLRDDLEASQQVIAHQKLQLAQNMQADADMDRVIKNLQDELEASKQVIVHQKEQLRIVLDSQEENEKEFKASSGADKGGWKARFLELHKRHLKLEGDRAWGEFKLRNRITADSIKFNRRLQHWKQQVQDLEGKLKNLQMVQDQAAVAAQEAPAQNDSKPVEQTPPRRGWWGRR